MLLTSSPRSTAVDTGLVEHLVEQAADGPLDPESLQERAQVQLSTVPPGSVQEARLRYQTGVALVARQAYRQAIPWLRRSLQLEPGRAHAHYLLGYCLARQADWAGALQAQQRSCGLKPDLADAWYEQGRAALELGQESLAQLALERAAQLRPAWQAALAVGHCARVRRALREGVEVAAIAIRVARDTDSLPSWLLLEWCELAGDLLLAGNLRGARLLLDALAYVPARESACRQSLPQRPALVLLAVIVLLEPGDPSVPEGLSGALRESRCLPASAEEQSLWSSLLEPALALVLARWPQLPRPEQPVWQQEMLRPLLAVLPLLRPQSAADSPAQAGLQRLLAAGTETDGQRLLQRLQQDPDPLSCEWLPDVLKQWLPVNPGQQSDPALTGSLRLHLDRYLEGLSQLMLERPSRLVRLPGQESEALALRRRLLQALIAANAAMARLDGQPAAPQRLGPRRRWLLLANTDLPQCFLYRVEQKRQQLERLGCQVRVVLREQLDHWTYTPELLWADALVVCRMAATHQVLRAMAAARRFGLSVYYDIDDLLFDAEHCPPPLASYGGTITPLQHRLLGLDQPLFAEAMALADGLIVSTETLAERWCQLHPNGDWPIAVLPNLAPPELLRRQVLVSESPRSLPAATTPEPLRLVFASGTAAHKQAWRDELAPALAYLLAADSLLELDVLGQVQLPEPLLPYAERIRCHPYSDYASYLARLAEADIGLVVLEPGIYTDAKSAIRWMEFSLLGVASVLSPTATYRQIIRDGEEALFARGAAAWVRAIGSLINDPGRRLAIARRARQKALQLFGPHRAGAFWLPLIQGPGATEPVGWPAKRKLLVINVFFAPQSVGGATRVAQDQVRELIERAGDRYEITVLCADHSPWQRNNDVISLDCHGWHGARVVRLSLPPRPWSWHHDGPVESFCRQWFAEEGFDLIHAHCLQILSAAPLRVASELGIPYLVTIHDGWWLSPQLFLTTRLGAPVDPADPLGHHDHPAELSDEQRAADLERRRDLELVLAGARARLVVSEAFAQVYAQAGIGDLSVLTNDWQPMVQTGPGRRPQRLPLRFCFVGGMALHKGYAVLKTALLRHRLADAGAGAQLTVIDSTLQPHEHYDLNWNGTPVLFRPSVPMDAMASFYGEQDVLLAPSIWPESFGLVTREALSAGLWVVASSIGALAEPIIPGVNGHTVPPGDADALGQVLLELCREHPTPKPLQEPVAGSRAVDHLLELYDCVAAAGHKG